MRNRISLHTVAEAETINHTVMIHMMIHISTLKPDSFIHNVCLCRFFFMYLINKDETEHTGQVFPIILSLSLALVCWWFCVMKDACLSLSFRSRTFGKCTRNVAGNSFPPATVSGNNTRTSSTKNARTALSSGGSTRSEYTKFIAAPFLPSDATSFHERTQRLMEERDVTEETDSSGGRANAARFFRRDPVPYARWRWDGASAGTPQDSRLLCCSVRYFRFFW